MTIGIIKNSKKFLGLSIFLVVISLGVILIKGLNYGIDFSGGNLIQVKFNNQVTLSQVNEKLDEISENIEQLRSNSRKVQVSEGSTVILRTQELNESEKETVLKKFGEVGEYKLDKIEKVGASVGEELKKSAVLSLLIGAVLIVAYITMRFEFVFSLGAILALIHDLIIAVGVISLLGYEIDTPFIAAVLTILGYSINDTIIVFDRIRENFKRKTTKKLSLEELLDKSINQVMIRSINTSVTTLFAIVAILIFGGDSLRTFIVTLLVGILAGTYSSVFIATPIVYYLDKNKKGGSSIGKMTRKENEKDKKPKDKILV